MSSDETMQSEHDYGLVGMASSEDGMSGALGSLNASSLSTKQVSDMSVFGVCPTWAGSGSGPPQRGAASGAAMHALPDWPSTGAVGAAGTLPGQSLILVQKTIVVS